MKSHFGSQHGLAATFLTATIDFALFFPFALFAVSSYLIAAFIGAPLQ